MKNFYKVSNTIENGPRMDRVKSRISPINHRLWTVIGPMLFVAFGLFGVNEEMWGKTYTTKGTIGVGQGKGTVQVEIWTYKVGDDTNDEQKEVSEGKDAVTVSGNANDSWKAWEVVYRYFRFWAKSPAEGYTFDAWYTNKACTEGKTTNQSGKDYYQTSTSNKGPEYEYYAKFVPNPYTIAYNNNGGSGSMSNTETEYDASVKLRKNSFTKQAYLVTYNANGGSGCAANAYSYYEFTGWRKGNASTGDQYVDEANVSNLTTTKNETVTMYAQWGNVLPVILPEPTVAPTNAGEGEYSFAGWDDGAKVYAAGASYTPTSNVTLTAKWTLIKEPIFSGESQNMEVDDTYAGFSFSNTSTETPSADSNDKFYYVIETTTAPTGKRDGSSYPNDVISFDGTTVTALNNGVATIKFYQDADASNNIASGESETYTFTVSKKDPVFTWSTQTYYYNSTYLDIFSSSNHDTQLTCSTTNDGAAEMVNGTNSYQKTLKTYNGASATITIEQAENYKWNYKKVDTYAITNNKANNHVAFTVVDGNKSTFEKSKTSNVAWNSAGYYKLGNGDWGISKPDDNIIIGFEGYPDILSFTLSCDPVELAGTHYPHKNDYTFEVFESATNGNWVSKWTNDNSADYSASENVQIQLSPSTRFIKLRYKGTCWGRFTNIAVSELQYFRRQGENTTMNFGTSLLSHAENEPAVQSFVVEHANAGYQTSVTAPEHYQVSLDNVNFASEVVYSTNATALTGGDKMDTFTVYVKYLADAIGTHNANVTVHNNLRSDFNVPVTGTTKDKIATQIEYCGASSYSVDAANIASTTLFRVRDTDNDTIVTGVGISLSCEENEQFSIAGGNALDPECGGTNNVKPSFAGNDTYAAATNNNANFAITITRLADEISFGNGKIVLIAGNEEELSAWNITSNSQTEGATLTFSTSNSGVLRVEGGKIIAVSKGEAKLYATSENTCTYAAGVDSLTIKVRNTNDPCETTSYLNTAKTQIKSGKSLVATITEGKHQTLTVSLRAQLLAAGTNTTTIELLNNANGVLFSHTFKRDTMSNNSKTYSYDLSGIANIETAKTIRVTGNGSTYYQEYELIKITQQRYLNHTGAKNIAMTGVKACEEATHDISINYSDVSTIQLNHQNSNFSYTVVNGNSNGEFNNDCGDFGTFTLRATVHPLTKDEYKDSIFLTASGLCDTIVLTLNATKPEREIVWNQDEISTATATTNTDLVASVRTKLCLETAGTVTFTIHAQSEEGVASLSGNVLSFHKQGTVTVKASAAETDDYLAAADVTKTWNVSKVGASMATLPTITSTITCGDELSAVTYNEDWQAVSVLNANDVIAGHIIKTGPASFTTAGDAVVNFNFYPTNVKVYDVLEFTVPITVQHIASNATPSAEAITYGEAISSSTLSNSGTTAGTWTWNTENNDAVLDAGQHTLNVHFTPENSNYSELDATVTLTVNKADAGVTPAAVEFTYGGKASDQTLSTATGSLAGTWSWTDSQKDATLAAGNYEMDVRFTPTDADNYNVLDTKVTVTVNKANAGVTPAAVEFTYGGKASDQTLSTATGSLAGTWSWIDAQKDATLAVSNYEMNVRFTPTDADNYNVLNTKVTVTVNKADAGVTPAAVEFTYGGKASDQTLSTATGSLAGTWSWIDAQKDATLAAGNYEMDVRFTPTDADNYNVLNTTVAVTVNKATTSLNWTNAPEDLAYNATGVTYTASSASDGAITYSIIAGGAYAHIDSESGVLTIDEPGHTITIQASQAAGTNHTAPVAITVDVTIGAAPSAPTFNNAAGDNDWQNAANWSNGEVPSGVNPNVIISGELIVNEDVTVGGLTIESTGSVAVVTNGTLTINGTSETRSEYGNLFVANGGEVDVNGTLHVGDLTVEASIGTENGSAESGQIAQAEHIAYANAYIEINMVPNGGPMDDSKWYGFTVPFAVNAYTGIAHKEGSSYVNCNYGSDIIIAEYDANKRLNTGNGWKYISSPTLNPGQFYFFGADGGYNTFRFKASASSYTPAAAASLSVNGSTTNPHANWNGVGNSMLQHATASYAGGSYVQVYKNGLDAYEAVPTGSATFVVGCPFFVQATEATTLVLNVQNEVTAKYYAPSRVDNVEKVACVQLASVDGGYADHVYVSATDKEQNAYRMGHDLSKAGISAIVPQLWVNQYNQQLCVHEAALQGNNAACALGIFAPKSGDYLLSVAQADNAEIYLTMNGQPIWNLSQSEYLLSLNKGTNDSYGLMMVNAPQVTTGVDEVAGDNAQVSKIILNNQLYIIKNGQIFDATGKKVQ